MRIVMLLGALASFAATLPAQTAKNGDTDRREEYITAVTRGAGLLPWQKPAPSETETAFRREIEARKVRMLASRGTISHPLFLTEDQLAQARRNIEETTWGKKWFESLIETADYIAAQPDGYVVAMISELSPHHLYGFTCPNCVGRLSQEGVGGSIVAWDFRNPDFISCRRCGHVYPSEEYPETAVLQCPRMGQTFTFFLNEREWEHPENRSGELAYHWVGHPMHVSFSGIVRYQKIHFMIGGVQQLALAYVLTGEEKYAEKTVPILVRLAECYRNWLYSDYWDTIADCDPMYAAWHDRSLPLEWKRHLCENAFRGDTLEKARMLQSYWGAGRCYPTTDVVSVLTGLSLAYDLVHDAKDSGGNPLWTPGMREKVEKDLLLEWIIGAEPFVGGEGKAEATNNKAPRIYNAQASVAMVLGLPDLADVALRGYEAVRDESFLFDGFSRETPGYNNMYLSQLVMIPETLHGFHWPETFHERSGTVDLYENDSKLRLMFRAPLDQRRPDGRHLPLGDTNVQGSQSPNVSEIGLNRYPEYYAGTLPTLLRGREPGSYAVFHLEAEEAARDDGLDLPEIFFPAWMTAILRHGTGSGASLLSLTFSPPGGHRHSDNLALFYADRGDTILGDHGYVGDMPVNGWIHTTESHNLVIVDDTHQRFGGERPRRPALSFMVTSPKASIVEASSEVYDQCTEYRRLVALIKGPDAQTFAVDIFRVKGGKKHDYRVFSELAASDAEEGSLEFHGIDMPPEPPLPDFGGSIEQDAIFGLRDIRKNTAPASGWQAVWKEKGRSYRLWVLGEADEVWASNGPGQETRTDFGRRVRYVDAIREGDDLSSTFVAVHEPSGPDGSMPVHSVEPLAIPEEAGPDAVAVGIRSAWGSFALFSEIENEVEFHGIRLQGRFALLCERPDGGKWLLTSGCRTFRMVDAPQGRDGFSGRTTEWSGSAAKTGESTLTIDTRRPSDWPDSIDGIRNYVTVEGWDQVTGFPVRGTGENTIQVERFPLPDVTGFTLPAVRYLEW